MRLARFTAIALTILPAAARADEAPASATQTTQPAASPSPTAQSTAQPTGDATQADHAAPVYTAGAGTYPYPQPFVHARTRRNPLYTGGPIPAGMHVESRRNAPLLLAGAVLFGSAYLGSALAGASCSANPRCSSGLEWLFVPFGGPFIALAYPHSVEATGPLVLAGVMQTAGIAFIAAGIILSRRVLVENPYDGPTEESRSPQWSLVPSAPGALAGISFSLTYY